MSRLSAITGCLLALGCAQRTNLDAAVSEREAANLFTREAGSAATDYSARLVRLRLFGVQGVGTPEASATLADTATWATRSWDVGGLVARNLRVARIDVDGLALQSSDGAVHHVRIGADADLRLVRHAFDLAAVDQGNHLWALEPSTLARIRARHGLGATAETFEIEDRAGVVLVEVAEEGLFGRLGLQSGDVVLTVDGAPAIPADLGRIADRLSAANSDAVVLSLLRGGMTWDATYSTR